MPDPKLTQLREEIKALVRKADVAAVVFLASTTHTNFLFEICPSWTCIRLENENTPGTLVEIRIRSKRVEYPSAEAQQADLARSLGLLLGLADALEQSEANLRALAHVAAGKGIVSHFSRNEPPGS